MVVLLVIVAVATALRVTDGSCEADARQASLCGDESPRENASVQTAFLESAFSRQNKTGCSGRWQKYLQSSDVQLSQMMLAQHLECEKWVGSGASGDTFIAMTTVPDGQMMGLSWPNDDILSLSNSYWANRGIEEGTEVAVKIQKCQETQMIPNREDNEKECLPDHEDPEFAVLRFMSGAELGTPGLVRMHAHAYLRFGYEAVVLERGYCDLRKLIFKRAEASNPCGTRELTVLDKFNIAKELVEGLQALHRHNIVHADIKPANIVTHTDRRPIGAVLIDFDGSCLEHSRNSRRFPELAIDFCDGAEVGLFGTEGYHAPENTGYFEGGKHKHVLGQPFDDRNSKGADIFSLGITIYELVLEESYPHHCYAQCDDRKKKLSAPEKIDIEDVRRAMAGLVQQEMLPERRPAELRSNGRHNAKLKRAQEKVVELLANMLELDPSARSMIALPRPDEL